MKILLTGFGSFLSHRENPSEEVANALKSKVEAVSILPVSYALVLENQRKLVKKVQPDFILSLGLASSRRYISLEENAFNEMNALHPDNDGVVKTGEAILPGQAASLKTKVNLSALKEELQPSGITLEISTDPGRYLCNEIYYLDLASGIPSLFVHFPALEVSSKEKDLLATEKIIAYLRAKN
jgi:pyroglutamyl-peptidase